MKVLIAVTMATILFAGCATNKTAEEYVKNHPELDPETRRRIMAREVVGGMTMAQVTASVGGPRDVRRNADGAEFWEYPSFVLVFREGVLANWVDRRTLY